MESNEADVSPLVFAELQFVLAEKRTTLALMRTGIAIIALPMSLVSFLIATSKYYTVAHILHLFIPLLIICSVLLFFGSYLIIRSAVTLRKQERLIQHVKTTHHLPSELL